MSRVVIALPRVLIVQSDQASGISVSGTLRRYGYSVVGPFDRWGDATEWSDTNTPDAAVLDWSAQVDDCLNMARGLVQGDVPFVFYSSPVGFQERPADLRQVPFLVKPDQSTLVLKLLSTALNERLVRRLQPADY